MRKFPSECPTHKRFHRFRAIIATMTVMFLAACSLPGAGVNADGGLKLLYAPFALEAHKLPEYWLYVPRREGSPLQNPRQKMATGTLPSPTALFWADIDGKIALGVSAYGAPGDGVELGRRTNIAILSTPFLSFDWQLQNGARPGDATLILGFRNQTADNWSETDFGVGLPGVDYVLQIPVGDMPTASSASSAPSMPSTAHSFWQTDYLDLATLHRRYWPKTDPTAVKLVWIGIASRPQQNRAPAAVTYLSHILLSR